MVRQEDAVLVLFRPCHHRGCCYRYSQVPRKEVISLRERLSGRPLVAVGGPLCYNRLNLSVTADAVPLPGLRHSAAAALCLRLAGRGPNNSSLFPPLAAVVVVALSREALAFRKAFPLRQRLPYQGSCLRSRLRGWTKGSLSVKH